MSAAMCNVDATFFYVINKAIFVIDPTAEFALQVSGQWFRLSYAVHASIAFDAFDELVDALQCLFVL